jgi:hypothetical protein
MGDDLHCNGLISSYFYYFILMALSLTFIHEDYGLAVERRFACSSDPESYAGGSVSS